MKLTTLAISMFGAAFLPLSIASAATITYVFNGTATGVINGNSFSDVSFTVTAVADPASIPSPTAGLITFSPTSISITDSAPHSTLTNIPGGHIFDNQSLHTLGFGVGADDIVFTDPSFATYNLKTSTGPFSESSDPDVANWTNVATSKGSLTVTSLTDLSFTATLTGGSSGPTNPSAVPLPSAAGMSLAGLTLCAIAAYRRSVAARAR